MGLNISLNTKSPSSSFEEAVTKHIDAGGGESLDEAVERILSGANVSDKDRERVISVHKALKTGELKREDKAYSKSGKLKKLGMAEVKRLSSILEEAERKRVLQDMKDNMPDNYVMVNTKEKLHKMIGHLDGEMEIPIDVETTGTDIYNDFIVGYVVSNVTLDIHYYVPTRHETDEFQLDHGYVTETLKNVLQYKEVLYVGHNVGFDIEMLRNEGIFVTGSLWDTQVGMALLNENEPSNALKNLATKYLRIPSMTYGELFGNVGFHTVSDLKLATSYAAKDGEITYKMYQFQKHQLEERFPEIYQYAVNIEMPLIYAVLEMERTGFTIDVDFAEEYGKELTAERDVIEAHIQTVLAPYKDDDTELNLSSPKQLTTVLEAHTGRALSGTSEKVLKPLAKQYEIISDILKLRSLNKTLSTYVEKLPKAINPVTGKLQANYKQNGAATGRFSSGGPAGNMQNQSPQAQQLFIAPEGKVWIEADFKAQEIRSVAYLSGEPVLINGFKEGKDPYATMASNYYGKPHDEVYKNADGSDTKERKEMKVVWLATLYGMSSFSLADMLGTDKKEAEKFQKELFESMPVLNAWLENTKEFASAKGFVWMDKKQRKRRLPEATQQRAYIPYGKYNDPEFEEQKDINSSISRALRQAPNAVVQGSSAIQTKATLIEAVKVCQTKDGWAIPNVIHDAIFWEVPEDFTREDAELITRTMVDTYRWGDSVENGTDLEVMRRWGDSVSLEDWFNNKEDE